MMTNKAFFVSCLLMLCTVSLLAQRVQVVDVNGTPIPFVTVTTAQGRFIATTDADGWFDGVGDNAVIHLSQVAYKPLTIAAADIAGGTIMLEEAGYGLPEVVVKPKQLLYCQTYFRDVYIDDEGPIFFRAGIIDNCYDIAKKEVSAKSRHLSKAQNGLMRLILSSLSGSYDKFARLPEESYYDKLLELEQAGVITLNDAGGGRQIVADSVSQLGYIHWDAAQRTRAVSFDIGAYLLHIENKKKQDKALKKGRAFVADTLYRQLSECTIYQVYRTDSAGNSRADDFVMSQFTAIGRQGHSEIEYLIQVQSFATAYAYIDKKEFKQLRKDSQVDMNIQELRRFEANNKIPPLPASILEQVNKLFEKD